LFDKPNYNNINELKAKVVRNGTIWEGNVVKGWRLESPKMMILNIKFQ